MEINLNFIFESPNHIRYEKSRYISITQGGANRLIKVEQDNDNDWNYLVTIYNKDGNHPVWNNDIQMSTKQMRIIESNSTKIVLRGWGYDNLGESFGNYGLTVNIKNSEIINCILHIYNRSIDIKYLNKDNYDDFDNDNLNALNSVFDKKDKNGVFVEYKIDGEKIEWTFVNDIKHGEYRLYFSNGKIKGIGNLENGKHSGSYKAFNLNGTVRTIGEYENGKETGSWIFNDDEGNLAAEGNYVRGEQKGKWIYYDQNGDVECIENF